MERLHKILSNQQKFQKLVGVDIDPLVEADRNRVANDMVLKIIQETVEMQREIPSSLNNPNNPKITNTDRVREELSDVMMYITNFCLLFKFSPEEMLEQLEKTQDSNFTRIKKKLMDSLNEDVLKVQNHISCVGQGNLTPKYIFVGQNPGSSITHGYKAWSDPADGSSSVLLPIIEKLGIMEDCYFTNLVKSTTPDNEKPGDDLKDFWTEFFSKELHILLANNPGAVVIAMGGWTDQALSPVPHVKISHPAYVMRGGIFESEYEAEIQKATSPFN